MALRFLRPTGRREESAVSASPGIEKLLRGFAPKRLIQPHRCVEAAANVEEVAVFAVPRRVLGAG
jgi:hypothetical protein